MIHPYPYAPPAEGTPTGPGITSMSRRQLMGSTALLVTLGLPPALPAQSSHRALPSARDLPAQARLAADRGDPLIVLVSLAGCAYCEIVRRDHLLPAARAGMVVAQLDLREGTVVRDFDGQLRSHDEVASAWQSRVAPTVLFLGPDGRELAPRIVGAGLADFYGAYLSERLSAARAALKTSGSTPAQAPQPRGGP